LERGKDSGRSDDTIEVIRKRFKTHQESAVPIIGYFKTQNIPVHTIDSAKGVEQVSTASCVGLRRNRAVFIVAIF